MRRYPEHHVCFLKGPRRSRKRDRQFGRKQGRPDWRGKPVSVAIDPSRTSPWLMLAVEIGFKWLGRWTASLQPSFLRTCLALEMRRRSDHRQHALICSGDTRDPSRIEAGKIP